MAAQYFTFGVPLTADQLGQPGGPAVLDGAGALPAAQLPPAVVAAAGAAATTYLGDTDATLVSGGFALAAGAVWNGSARPAGSYFVVTAAGTTGAALDAVPSGTALAAGARILSDGAQWTYDASRYLITARELYGGAVTAAAIAADAVTAAAIAAGAVGASELATDAVTVDKIAAGAVTTAKLAAGAVTAGELAADAVTAAAIAAGAVGASELAAGAVTLGKIAAGAADATALATDAVTSVKIAAGAVTAAKLAADAVTAAAIAAGAVGASELAADAVTAAAIAAGAVGSSELAAGAVTLGKIAAGAVDTAALATDAVTTAKIAAGAVGFAERAAVTRSYSLYLPNINVMGVASVTGANTTFTNLVRDLTATSTGQLVYCQLARTAGTGTASTAAATPLTAFFRVPVEATAWVAIRWNIHLTAAAVTEGSIAAAIYRAPTSAAPLQLASITATSPVIGGVWGDITLDMSGVAAVPGDEIVVQTTMIVVRSTTNVTLRLRRITFDLTTSG